LSVSGGVGTLQRVICPRCGHENPPDARFCSSCGAPLPGDDATSTLSLTAVEAAEEGDDLARYLDGLPPGIGLLVIRHGPNAGSTFRVQAAETTIGRHPDSDIFLDDITVSRRHVTIEKNGEEFRLRDVGSLNGTYVNRERVDAAELHHGDEVQIGKYRLSFVQNT
jgi:hypothetical protein